MLCAECGKEVPPGQQFCGNCGTAVAPPAPPQAAPIPQPVPQPVAPPQAYAKARVWVVILGALLTLSCFGAIVGIPLIITEVKRRPAGTPPRNTGWLIAGGILFGLMILAGIVRPPETSTTKSQPAQEQASAPAEQPVQDSAPASEPTAEPEQKSEYKIGEFVQLDNHAMGVSDVVTNFKSGNMFDKPQNSSNAFVVVHVVFKNTSDKDLSINSMGFQLEDETGTMRMESMVAGLSDQLETVELKPGGQVEGNIAFEAKAHSSVLKLHYSGGVFGGGEVVVNLKERSK